MGSMPMTPTEQFDEATDQGRKPYLTIVLADSKDRAYGISNLPESAWKDLINMILGRLK